MVALGVAGPFGFALASNTDSGFDPRRFAHALGALTQITDAAFAEYSVGQELVGDLRRRFTQWREELLNAKDP